MPKGMARRKDNTTRVRGSKEAAVLSWRIEWLFNHRTEQDGATMKKLTSPQVNETTTLREALAQYLTPQPVRFKCYRGACLACGGVTEPRVGVLCRGTLAFATSCARLLLRAWISWHCFCAPSVIPAPLIAMASGTGRKMVEGV